jgi:allophanate hydrolase subunit 2
MDGRALRTGDVLGGRRDGETAGQALGWPTPEGDSIAGRTGQPIRVVAGPAGISVGALVNAEWRVGAASDRVGLRLEGPALATVTASPGDGELLSHGVVDGAIQLPPGGAPIVLLADHQTTGGYPIVAVVISADHPRVGQLRPGAAVRFVEVSLADAHDALLSQRAAFERGAAALRRDSGWDDLWQSAGA